jgi:hypothetical protein
MGAAEAVPAAAIAAATTAAPMAPLRSVSLIRTTPRELVFSRASG